MSQGVVQELPGMPAPSALRRLECGGRCVVTFADRVLFCYDADDIGMRNMAVVAVTDAGVGGKETAAVFGLTPEYVSMLRGRARIQELEEDMASNVDAAKRTVKALSIVRDFCLEETSYTYFLVDFRARNLIPMRTLS
jgi:hypothetical protein